MNPKIFFGELKRRNVYKVAVAYAVVGWLLIQVATQVFPFLEIPNWMIRLVILLTAFGFPVALIIAWAFELTPEGIKRTEDADAARQHSHGVVWIVVVLIAAALSLGLFFLGRYTAGRDTPRQTEAAKASNIQKSIAVLPLVNTSGDPSNEYFSDGLSEELIAVLAKIPGLKVIGRNSSFLFKGKSGDSASIGQKLGVAQLIQGSVLRQGDRVRIIAEMISTRDGQALWSETYDREVKDVFAVQSEIAQAVAAQLKIKLLGEKPVSDSTRSNPNPAAHDAVLQAGFYLNLGNMDGYLKAINHATEATQLDPNYAEAWAILSEAWRAYLVSGAPAEMRAQAEASMRAAAARAYALDPKSIDALVIMADLAVAPDLNFAAAEKYARRAVELAPSDLDGLGALSSALIAQGKLQETLPLRREMAAINPLEGSYATGLIFVGLHRY